MALLEGKWALITGASSGIGLAVARVFAREGAHLTLVARREDRLREVAAELLADSFPGDVARAETVEALAAGYEDVTGETAPDIVVNAAGAFELSPLAETSVESFDRLIGANLRGPFLVARAFLPKMLARGSGHIVSIGSVAGRNAFPANGAYAASKFGLRGLHAVLDAELRGSGVRATLVEPAATDTPLWEAVSREENEGLPEPAAMLSAEDVAEAVLYAVATPPTVAIRNVILERS